MENVSGCVAGSLIGVINAAQTQKDPWGYPIEIGHLVEAGNHMYFSLPAHFPGGRIIGGISFVDKNRRDLLFRDYADRLKDTQGLRTSWNSDSHVEN